MARWSGRCRCDRCGAYSHKPGWVSSVWEHNYVRPCEVLGMRTPATVWHKSERSFDSHPPRWEYPAGAKVLKVGHQGKLDAYRMR